MLSLSKRLKERKECKQLYIVPDPTRAQQSMDKKLRDKLKEFKSNGEVNMKIQKGEIVRYVDGKKTVLYPVDN